jgi:hypothetical protein
MKGQGLGDQQDGQMKGTKKALLVIKDAFFQF